MEKVKLDDHELYVNIKNVCLCLCILLSMLIMRKVYTEVISTYVFIEHDPIIGVKLYMNLLIIVKFLVSVIPLLLSYPLVKKLNRWLYLRGYYYRLIKKYWVEKL